MNLDSKIKKELESEAAEIDRILAKQDDSGLFAMLGSSFRSNMRWWFILMNVITIILTVLMFWCGYNFFTAGDPSYVYWGFLMVVAFQVQIAAKQWIMNEMNRNNISREIKRVELAIAELAERLDK